jgi:CheY-like chemotaxis protein
MTRADILIVDDDPRACAMMAEICRAAGYSVEVVMDGAAGVAAATAGRHPLILLDIHMPGMDGIAVARAIRALPGSLGQVPIVAVTADLFPETRARCRAAGVNDQLTKPLIPAELLEKIAAHAELVSVD